MKSNPNKNIFEISINRPPKIFMNFNKKFPPIRSAFILALTVDERLGSVRWNVIESLRERSAQEANLIVKHVS